MSVLRRLPFRELEDWFSAASDYLQGDGFEK